MTTFKDNTGFFDCNSRAFSTLAAERKRLHDKAFAAYPYGAALTAKAVDYAVIWSGAYQTASTAEWAAHEALTGAMNAWIGMGGTKRSDPQLLAATLGRINARAMADA
jgi:hypothetical protein